MTDKKNRNINKKLHKWPFVLFGVFLLLILAIRLSLLTDPVHQFVKNKIAAAVNRQLKPTLSIGNITGDLWNEITITDVILTQGEKVVSIDTVRLEYSPLSYFGDFFEVQKILLIQPTVVLKQQPDSSWNIERWLTPAGTDTTASGAAFSFGISSIRVKDGSVVFRRLSAGCASSPVIDQLNLTGNLRYAAESYSTELKNLNFSIKNTCLPSPVLFTLSANAKDSILTLGKLAVSTANSNIWAEGEINLSDYTGSLAVNALPLGWKDIASFMDEIRLRHDIKLSAVLKGSAREAVVDLTINAPGIEQLQLLGRFRRDSTFALTTVSAQARQLDAASFFGDTILPGLHQLSFNASGNIPLNLYQNGRLRASFSMHNVRQYEYHLDALSGTFNLQNQNIDVHIEPELGGQKIIANVHADDIWNEEPHLKLTARGAAIDLSRWLKNEDYKSLLNFEARVSGEGWFPEDDLWVYNFQLDKSRLMGVTLNKAEFFGSFNSKQFTNRSLLKPEQGLIQLRADVQNLQEIPAFSYILKANKLNLAVLPGFRKFSSNISAKVKGSGTGNSLQNLQMQTGIQVDSSFIRGEAIRQLKIDAKIADSMLTILNGSLRSEIADGSLSGRFHLTKMGHPDSRAKFRLQLKDVTELAPLTGTQILQANGSIAGELSSNVNGELVFKGSLNLTDLNYDDQVTADTLNGNVQFVLQQNPQFQVDLDMNKPIVAAAQFQDIHLITEGEIIEKGVKGSYELEIEDAKNRGIMQLADYKIGADTATVTLQQFNISSQQQNLTLAAPFHASFSNGTLRTDTLQLHSDAGKTALALAVLYADSLRQNLYFAANNLDIASIQSIGLDELYVGGILSGEAWLNRSDSTLSLNTDLLLTEINYLETELDTLQLHASVRKDQIEAALTVLNNDKKRIDAGINLPFSRGKTQRFSDKPVSGHLRINEVSLAVFNNLLQRAGLADTEGLLQFNGSLKGTINEPVINTNLTLNDALLSGIPVDSLSVSAAYRPAHSLMDIEVNLINAAQQHVVNLQARLPVKMDLKSFDFAAPSLRDSIFVTAQLNTFNLKSLNDFVSDEKWQNIEGLVEGYVNISGRRGDLSTDGKITLKNGGVDVEATEIRLEEIESTILFMPNLLVLKNFTTKSGPGTLTAKGNIELENFTPNTIDIDLHAQNFEITNSSQFKGIVNMNMHTAGTVNRPNVTGSIDVLSGFIELSNFGEKSLEEVTLDTALAPEQTISLYDSLSLDMNIKFDERFSVRNRRYLEMEIRLDGQLNLLKKVEEEMQLFGTLNTVKGYAEPLGKRFELTEGRLAFAGPPANPQIHVKTLYEPRKAEQDIKIWYIIEGTVEKPEFKFESNPPMELQNIISYTLFGQPFYELGSVEQAVAGSGASNLAADFATEILLNRVEDLATRGLGVDVVEIDNSGGESGTAITTGWYINPKVFFALQNVIAGTPSIGFYLEYALNENLKLILSQDDDYGQGVDLRYEYDY